MDADKIYGYVNAFFKDFLPSTDNLRIRPDNNFITVVFSDDYDFVVSVLAATGANIETTVTGLFGAERTGERGIDSCALRFGLKHRCLDSRLIHFMHEVALMKTRDGNMTQGQAEAIKRDLQEIEQWIESQSP